ISAYDKQLFEHRKFPADDPRAIRLLAWERRLFAAADRVVADTVCHADFFRETLQVPPARLRVVYVGAEPSFVPPATEPVKTPGEPVEVLFYGSFIGLHGVETIIEAARRYRGAPVRWTLLGNGPMKAACQAAATGLPQLRFESAIPYGELCARIHRADILLGVFGTTPKAGRVMPNKVFQALAAGRPVITRVSEAYPETARGSDALAFVPPGDPQALADAVAAWSADPARLEAKSREARALFDRCFSAETLRQQLADLLSNV
ncbi:MAG: glycosyltransferase, partial [Kiritimatiellae bacterium]|nr:glycosyltransferase [Kiritimatiellia bacterium]